MTEVVPVDERDMQLPEVPDFYEIDAVHDPRPADQPSINRLHIQVKELQDERSKAKKVDRLQLACIALLFLMGFFSSSVCLALLIQGLQLLERRDDMDRLYRNVDLSMQASRGFHPFLLLPWANNIGQSLLTAPTGST
mmetsp:Transcript_7243/g.18813  ORF Transcript_7243/g.18813 Transcript_7243/m.18813 type:complete len:138 (+) Transcript_7243:197-610(+)